LGGKENGKDYQGEAGFLGLRTQSDEEKKGIGGTSGWVTELRKKPPQKKQIKKKKKKKEKKKNMKILRTGRGPELKANVPEAKGSRERLLS